MSYAFLALHGRAVRRESSRDHTRDAACVVVRSRWALALLACVVACVVPQYIARTCGVVVRSSPRARSCVQYHRRVPPTRSNAVGALLRVRSNAVGALQRVRSFPHARSCVQYHRRVPPTRSNAVGALLRLRSNAVGALQRVRSHCFASGTACAQGRYSLCLAACGVVQRCASCGLACLARYRSVWCNTSHVAHEPLNLDDDHSICACVSAGTCTASRTRCPT